MDFHFYPKKIGHALCLLAKTRHESILGVKQLIALHVIGKYTDKLWPTISATRIQSSILVKPDNNRHRHSEKALTDNKCPAHTKLVVCDWEAA